jgi:hypothetical protein
MGGVLLNTTFAFAEHGSVIFWVITCSCALLASSFTLCAYNGVVIFMTSFTGSYIFVRGISLYTGGYTSEFEIMQLIKNGQAAHIDPVFYAWLGGILVLTIISCVVQCKLHKKAQVKS